MEYKVWGNVEQEDLTDQFQWVIIPNGELRFVLPSVDYPMKPNPGCIVRYSTGEIDEKDTPIYQYDLVEAMSGEVFEVVLDGSTWRLKNVNDKRIWKLPSKHLCKFKIVGNVLEHKQEKTQLGLDFED